jgi:CRP-like cAMP-binding protein
LTNLKHWYGAWAYDARLDVPPSVLPHSQAPPAMLDTRRFDIARFLGRMPLFTDIGEDALSRLAEGCAVHRFERGAMVFHMGDPCDSFQVVVTGQVKLFALSPAGHEKVIELVGPGGSFAEALMFLGKPCMVNAQALTDALLVSVGRQAVMDELAADSQFAMRMLAGLSRRLHGLVHDVQAYALQNGVQRVIGYLLNERPEGDGTQSEAVVSLPVSKATVASRLSLTPEYFSRVLRELEDARLIEVDKRDIRIVDPQRLARYPG